MYIAGVQPLSLLDYPSRPCSIIFTQGCIFRCAYCHNPQLIPLPIPQPNANAEHNEESVISFLSQRAFMIDAVCITGGEPTIQEGLGAFLEKLKEKGFSIKLDTSGARPDVVEDIIFKRLVDYIAMDIKNRWEAYPRVTHIEDPQYVRYCRKTLQLIQESGIAHEFRTTILPEVHTADDFYAIAGELKSGEQYYIQRTRFKKTLAKNLSRNFGFSLPWLVQNLSKEFPHLSISLR